MLKSLFSHGWQPRELAPLWTPGAAGKRLRIVARVVALAGAAVLPLNVAAVELPAPIVSAKWLHAHLGEVTIIGVRANPAAFTTAPRYSTGKNGHRHLVAVGGHIKGASVVRWQDLRAPRVINGRQIGFMREGAFAFQSIMQDAGVSSGKPIVIVSPADASPSLDAGVASLDMAARLDWALTTFGTADVAVLNGGLAGWLQAGYGVQTKAIEPFPGEWTAKKPDLKWTADTARVASAVSHGVQLVDARPIQQFLGISKSSVVSDYGHIPDAHSLPTEAIARQEGIATYYLSKAKYKQVLGELGIDPKQTAITYCNTGHFAAGAWFVLHEIMGAPHTRLYDGSMLEWTTEGHPVAP